MLNFLRYFLFLGLIVSTSQAADLPPHKLVTYLPSVTEVVEAEPKEIGALYVQISNEIIRTSILLEDLGVLVRRYNHYIQYREYQPYTPTEIRSLARIMLRTYLENALSIEAGFEVRDYIDADARELIRTWLLPKDHPDRNPHAMKGGIRYAHLDELNHLALVGGTKFSRDVKRLIEKQDLQTSKIEATLKTQAILAQGRLKLLELRAHTLRAEGALGFGEIPCPVAIFLGAKKPI